MQKTRSFFGSRPWKMFPSHAGQAPYALLNATHRFTDSSVFSRCSIHGSELSFLPPLILVQELNASRLLFFSFCHEVFQTFPFIPPILGVDEPCADPARRIPYSKSWRRQPPTSLFPHLTDLAPPTVFRPWKVFPPVLSIRLCLSGQDPGPVRHTVLHPTFPSPTIAKSLLHGVWRRPVMTVQRHFFFPSSCICFLHYFARVAPAFPHP